MVTPRKRFRYPYTLHRCLSITKAQQLSKPVPPELGSAMRKGLGREPYEAEVAIVAGPLVRPATLNSSEKEMKAFD